MAEVIKVMLDTNVIISAVGNPDGTPFRAYVKASAPPYALVLCDQILDELRRVFNLKFSSKIPAMERFLAIASYDLVTAIHDADTHAEESIRDVNDRPILRAALMAEVKIFVTGDKDFLESGLEIPEIMTPAQFLRNA
jgi:putative PIN family toxin of toxin-antitoxin system